MESNSQRLKRNLILKLISPVALLLICGGLLTYYATASAQDRPIPGIRTVIAPFQPLIGQLQSQTRIPIVLPIRISLTSVYPSIRVAEAETYEISLDAKPDCRGTGYCSDGQLTGQQIYRNTPSIEQTYAFENEPAFRPIRRSPEKMSRVALSRGIQGYFVPYVCGANCDTSKVIWEQNSYRYLVGIRAGSKAAVVDLANSIIENEK